MIITLIDLKDLTSDHPFVSCYWAELKNNNGWDSEAYKIEDDKKVFQILVLYKSLIFKNKLAYIPFSPICINGDFTLSSNKIENIIKYINKITKNKVIFFRIDLPFEYKDLESFEKIFQVNKESIQPEKTVKISLQQNIFDIRLQYKKRAKRNLIKNKNVITVEDVKPTKNNIEVWYSIYEATAKRDCFQTRSLEYINNIFLTEDIVKPKLLFAYKEGVVVAGIIILIGKKEAVYLLGASKRIDGFSPSYSLQDYAIELSKNLGLKQYDLFGIGSDEKSKHLKSLTLFKSSFGGEFFQRIPTLDYPIKKISYLLFKIVEYFRFRLYR